jgi:hypothetical protein
MLQKTLIILILTIIFAGCFKVAYKFTDITISDDLKTFKVAYFENKARYVNPQLTPKITDKLRQKIINQTKLTNTNTDGDIEISGYLSDYSVSTSGVGSGTTTTTNRLNVAMVINIKYAKTPEKNIEENINRSFDFNSNLSLAEAESKLSDEIIKNVVDEIFNKLFSKW